MSIRKIRISGSVVTVAYDDHEEAPAFQERRLETELRRLFPAGCGVAVAVQVAWTEDDAHWRLRGAQVDMGGGLVEIGPGLADSLRSAELPLVLGVLPAAVPDRSG